MNNPSEAQLQLFNSLFKGRTDVYAFFWQKGKKQGFVPAYDYDPYMFRLHKKRGGTLKDYKDKKYATLTDQQIKEHLTGTQLIGIYPLLKDNTSWFIAADFDGDQWVEESLTVIKTCREKGIPAYLERSKSGNGGHVWVFFDQPYLAAKSRKILLSILEETRIVSIFDKAASFDRLFPNQDFLSGKGLGNLIALPLYKPALDKGNSCFVDENLEPYEDQWKFLASIQRISTPHLEDIYGQLTDNKRQYQVSDSGKLQITINNKIHLNRNAIPRSLINYLKEELNFANQEYFIRKNSGKSNWNIPRYFKILEEDGYNVFIPRGFMGRLLRFCKDSGLKYRLKDDRKLLKNTWFSTNFSLQPYQEQALKAASKKDFGVIIAPPGSGKTVIALKIIAKKMQPALIIVHRKQLMEQWIEQIKNFLGIPKNEIGRIGQGKVKVGEKVTVAMIQSLAKQMEKQGLSKSFGTIIVDECHHIPAKTYRNTITQFASYYQYGLTATPFRKNNDDKLIFIHLGEVIAEIKPNDIQPFKKTTIQIRNTDLDVPFNPEIDTFETLSNVLIHDSGRNNLIVKDVQKALSTGAKGVIITERKAHIDTLYQFLKQSFETLTLSGDDSKQSRKAKWKTLQQGRFQLLITTGQLFGEGTDLHNVSHLFLAYPFAFKGKLIQYIGRVQRSELAPVIYDYRDQKIDYLNKLFLKRNAYYREIDKQASLFDDYPEQEKEADKTTILDKSVKIPIEKLSFRYGAIAFQYQSNELNRTLDFEVENVAIRPEFEVLKPYFSKVLGEKHVKVNIYAELKDRELVAQLATSEDLAKINEEVIESVKFRFANKQWIGNKTLPKKAKSLLELNDLVDSENGSAVYESAHEMIDNILNHKSIKHGRQLRYLAARHNDAVLKIRFVLKPFSFVFLLNGKEKFHIILETLDIEEATYVWHIKGVPEKLQQNLQQVEHDLNTIKNKGRQAFLKNPPQNFSRVLHDYTDDRKGFMEWKARLEERLV